MSKKIKLSFRSVFMKPYLGGRGGAISLNLRKEQSNQQPQQQRYRAGFSEHSSFFSFTRVM